MPKIPAGFDHPSFLEDEHQHPIANERTMDDQLA